MYLVYTISHFLFLGEVGLAVSSQNEPSLKISDFNVCFPLFYLNGPNSLLASILHHSFSLYCLEKKVIFIKVQSRGCQPQKTFKNLFKTPLTMSQIIIRFGRSITTFHISIVLSLLRPVYQFKAFQSLSISIHFFAQITCSSSFHHLLHAMKNSVSNLRKNTTSTKHTHTRMHVLKCITM